MRLREMRLFLHASGLLLWVLSGITAFAMPLQQTPRSMDATTLLEALHDLSENRQAVNEEELAVLLNLTEHPIDLNRSTTAELLQIPFVDALQAASIVAYRDSTGSIESPRDLSDVLNLSARELELFQLFVVARPLAPLSESSEKPFFHSIVQGYSRQLDLPAGYRRTPEEGGFMGSPAALYTRLDARFKDYLSLRLTLEKDAGESFSWQPSAFKPGFDHVTGGLQFEGRKILKSLILGDYNVSMGQGLLLWKNTARGKGTLPLQDPIKKHAGIKPSASREENAFFRGVGLALGISSVLEAAAFFSYRTLDATLYPTADSTMLALGAHQRSGLHRTFNELARKDAFTEKLSGGALLYRSNRLELGVSGYRSQFSHPYVKGNQPADYFDFEGRTLHGLGMHTTFRIHQMMGFTEIARSFPGGHAVLGGIKTRPSTRFDVLLQGRFIEKNYHTFHGNAFAEQNTGLQNETGLYAAAGISPHPYWAASFFVDVFHHPWLRTTISRPSHGLESFGELVYNPRAWLRASLQYRFKLSPKNERVLSALNQLILDRIHTRRHSLRVQLDYVFSPKLRLRSRIDIRTERTGTSTLSGAMTLHDVFWTPEPGTRLQVRISLFDARGITLYAYENDLRYRFTIRALSGSGTRCFILLRKRIKTHLTLEAKYGATTYGTVTTRGSGADAFSGTLARALNVQILFQI